DPTPGWTGNPETGPVQTWPLSDLFAGLDLPSLPVGSIVEAGMAAFGLLIRPLIVLILALIGVVGGLRFWKWWANHKIGNRFQHILGRDPARWQIFVAYRRAQRQLKTFRTEAQTAQEHAITEPELQELANLVDVAAYRPQPPESSLVERA